MSMTLLLLLGCLFYQAGHGHVVGADLHGVDVVLLMGALCGCAISDVVRLVVWLEAHKSVWRQW